jgi:hypothetical protein
MEDGTCLILAQPGDLISGVHGPNEARILRAKLNWGDWTFQVLGTALFMGDFDFD